MTLLVESLRCLVGISICSVSQSGASSFEAHGVEWGEWPDWYSGAREERSSQAASVDVDHDTRPRRRQDEATMAEIQLAPSLHLTPPSSAALASPRTRTAAHIDTPLIAAARHRLHESNASTGARGVGE